nr:rhamnogalacturonan acetylesterase [Paenibacillus turpanensis]
MFIAGDSTSALYIAESAPMAGWGQMIGQFFTDDVIVVDEGRNGRSSKSFITEGHFDRIKNHIGKNDYLFIQFGHNDEKADEERRTEPFTTYQETLTKYVELAREAGANPVLITPVQRRSFSGGQFTQSHGKYPMAVKQLAERLGVPLIDLCARSEELYLSLGEEGSKKLFVQFEQGAHPNYPNGVEDNTHFNADGAREIAKLICGELAKSEVGLKGYLKEE